MLGCLPHPAELVICDIYKKMNLLESFKEKIKNEYGFEGIVRVLGSTSRIPKEFYHSTLIVGATNVPDVVDLNLIKPGTLIIDDSAPHCFNPEDATRRFRVKEDVLFSEGGVLWSSDPITQLRHVDLRMERRAGLFYREVIARSRPQRITGCVFSSLLSTCFQDVEPTVGKVEDRVALKHYQKLVSLGYRAFNLHCGGFLLPQTSIENFGRNFGRNQYAGRPNYGEVVPQMVAAEDGFKQSW
jgi:hypothetical protein